MFKTTFGACAFTAALLASTSAYATVVDFDGASYVNSFHTMSLFMGTLDIGQTGTITNFYAPQSTQGYQFGRSEIEGYISPNSAVVFTYTFAGLTSNTVSYQPYPPNAYTIQGSSSMLSSVSYYQSGNGPAGSGFYDGNANQEKDLGTNPNPGGMNRTEYFNGVLQSYQLLNSTAQIVLNEQTTPAQAKRSTSTIHLSRRCSTLTSLVCS